MKVILHKLFPYAPYLNEYIGFEKEVGDSEEEALATVIHLRSMAEQAHRDKYPHLYQNGNESMILSFNPHQPLPEINKEAERVEIAIDNSKSLEELNRYVNEAMKYGLIKQFINKKKQLQQ